MLEENILPCRSLCEEAKAGCETVLLNFVGLPWPDRLNCEQFPESGEDQVCVENKNAQPNKKIWGKLNYSFVLVLFVFFQKSVFFTNTDTREYYVRIN